MNSMEHLNHQHEIFNFLNPNDLSDFHSARKSSLKDLIPTVLYAYLEFSTIYFNDQNLLLSFRAFLLNNRLWTRTVEEIDFIIQNTVAHKLDFLNQIHSNLFEDLKKASEIMNSSQSFSQTNVLFHLMKLVAIRLGCNIVIFNKNKKKIIHRNSSYFCIPVFRRKENYYILYPTSFQYLQTIYSNPIKNKDKLLLHCGHSPNEPNNVSNANISCRLCSERLYTVEIKINYPKMSIKDQEKVYQVKTNKKNNKKNSYEEKKVYVKVGLKKNQNTDFDEFNKKFECGNCNEAICLYCSVSNKNHNEANIKAQRHSGYKCRHCHKEFSKAVKKYIQTLSDHSKTNGMPDRFHPNDECKENFLSNQ